MTEAKGLQGTRERRTACVLFHGKGTAKAIAAGEVTEEEEGKEDDEAEKEEEEQEGFASDFLIGEQIKIH